MPLFKASSPNVFTATLSSNQNDWTPTGFVTTFPGLQVIDVTVTGASRKVTGIAASPTGSRVLIRNLAASDCMLWLEHSSTLSIAANRITLPNAFPAFLMPGDMIELTSLGTGYSVSAWPSQGMAMGLTFWDDFATVAGNPGGAIGSAGIFPSGSVGTGSNVSTSATLVDTTEKPSGVVAIQTGTTTTGRGVIGGDRSAANNNMVPAQGCALSVARLARITAVSGTETYTLTTGFTDGAGVAVSDGVMWEFRWNGSAEEWSQVNYAATVATRTASGSPAVDGTFLWACIFINAAWTRADFFYSTDSKTFTIASSPSTGFPTAAQLTSWVGASIFKSAGTTNAVALLDHCGWRYAGGARG